MFPRGLLYLASVLIRIQRGAAQDSFIEVISPVSGDVYSSGDDVRVEWEAPLDSSVFDISLLNDGVQVVEEFCEDGCLNPNGFLDATLPIGLEAGTEYYFLVGDRLNEVSNFGESGRFEVTAAESSSETGDGGDADAATGDDAAGGDGDSLEWGIMIGAVAAGLGVIVLCILAVVCCRKRRHRQGSKDGGTANPDRTGGGSGDGDCGGDGGDGNGDGNGKGNTGGGAKGTGATRDAFGSAGGASDLSGFADMVALSPVLEENKEVVTKNPMITAMAKGAQFHSSGGGSNRFNSNGGSSKFPSLGEASSNGGGSWMRGAQGDEEEEGGGMFADADVVAALAAAAAQGVGRKERTPLKTAGSGTPQWDGSWAKSPAWNRQKSLAGQLSPSLLAAPKAEEKKAEGKAQEAESKPDPEGGSSGEPTTDWMVFTRESFNSHKSADAAALLAAVKAQASLGAREEKKESVRGETTGSVEAPPVEKKAEELQGASTATAAAAKGAGTGRPAAESYARSPQSVDGISAKAFDQAEVVASALPVVEREGVSASEPECEVPKPALSAGRRGTATRQSDYSWLLSAPGSGEKPRPDEDRGSRGSPVQTSPEKAALVDPSSMATAGLARTGSPPSAGTTSAAASRSPSKLPIEPAQDRRPPAQVLPAQAEQAQAEQAQAPPRGGAGSQSAGVPDNGSTATKPAQQGETPTLLHLPPKAQGAPPRRAHLAPVAGGGSRGFNLASPQAGGGRSPRGSKSPRGPRVSQFVEVFEGLTPRSKNGQASGILTAGATMASPTFPPPVPGTSKTGPPKAMPPKLELPKPAPAPAVPLPAAKKRAPAPGGLTPGAATGWSTPVATPDRGSITAVPATRKAMQGPGGSKDSAKRAAEEAGKIAAGMDSAGMHGASVAREGVPSGAGGTSARGAGSGWSTPVASPDRTLSAAGSATKAPLEDLIAEEVPKDAADGAPEELATAGSDAPAGGAGRGWSTPVATPDRTPRTSAPDSGPGGGTPECTGGAYPPKAGRTGESPMDERHFAWQLESPAGVDGMPSPTGSSDPRRLAIGKKGGRIIPAILGVADTPPVAERAPLLTPSTANNKAPPHSLASTEGSSIGAGSTWDMERSFESSQVAAFVAHAQAEAAAEAEAAVVEAQAEAAEKEAAEEQAAEEEGAEEQAAEKKAAEKKAAEKKAAEEQVAEEQAADKMSRTVSQVARVESKDAATQSSPKPDYGEGRAGPASLEVAAGGAAAVPVAPEASSPVGAAGAAAGLSSVTAAPALATIAARLSPISAFPATSPPAIVATPSPITAISTLAVEEHKDVEGVNSQAEVQLDEALETKAQTPTSEAVQAEAQASQAVKAALAAATAAAEANAAAAAAAAEAAKAAKKAEQAADEAAVAKAAKQKLADVTTTMREAEEEEKEEVAERVKEAKVVATKAEPTVTSGPVVGRTGDVGVVNVSIYSTDAAANAPDVYNDGQDTDTDTLDSQGDGSEEELEIDVGDERDWSTSTAAIPVAAIASIGEVLTAPVDDSGGDKQAVQDEGVVDGDGGAESREVAGVAAEPEQEEVEVDSLSGETVQPSGLDASPVSVGGEAEGGEEGSHQAPTDSDDEGARRDTIEHYAGIGGDARGDGGGGGGGYYVASPRESVHHLSASKMLGSSSGALSWSEDAREEEGEAEREAKEVQALVAEALALVKEANEEA